MPACSGKVLHRDGSKASGIKVEGKSDAGMTGTRTGSDGSFDLSSMNTSGKFQKVFVDGDEVDRNVSGGNHIYYLKR